MPHERDAGRANAENASRKPLTDKGFGKFGNIRAEKGAFRKDKKP